MISPREATLSLMGALRLARFDEKGALFFNTTLQGFWNSFWVAALIAPLYFLEFVLRWNLEDVSAPGLRYFSVEIIMYAMGWVAFPLAMVYVCRLMGWSQRFLVFGVANNWADLIVSAFAIPVQIAITTGVLTGSAMSFMLASVIVYSLGLSWFVARHTLNITGLAASGVVALSVMINFMIRYWGAVLLI
ncbi:hypothetical protein [Magnetovibrio sp.]|uniref:hypothetical protein n=1 Tax=Magnetovibrio sp. TaxID=2024836 RepID=UPI002F937CE2